MSGSESRTNGVHGRNAVVTGATSGIGAAIARRLVAGGATCLLLGRNEERGRAVVDSCEGDGSAVFMRCDVASADDVSGVAKYVKAEWGGVDILVNNAGITRDTLLMRMKEEDWDQVLETNLKSVYLMTKALSAMMMKARYGRIVTITSVVGVHGNAGQSNYAASKAGLIGFTKSIAKELGPRGITANAVAPGFIETPMTDVLGDDMREAMRGRISVGRLGTPEDIASAVGFFASEEASYVTGQVLTVDGCLSL